MARRVSDKAWRTYTKRLDAQRAAAREDAYTWVMRHAKDGRVPMEKCRRMMSSSALYHGRSTAALAASYFDQMAVAEGADAVKAIAVLDPMDKRAQTMAIALNKSLPKLKAGDTEGFAKAIAAAVAEDVKRQASNTMLFNAAKNGAEFAWIPGGDETCAYCIAVAAAGWTPARKATAMGEHEDHIHDNCMCEFAIRFNEDTKYASYDPSTYKDQYDSAEGSNSREKINSMRREYYAENIDEMRAQQRENYAIRTAAEG